MKLTEFLFFLYLGCCVVSRKIITGLSAENPSLTLSGEQHEEMELYQINWTSDFEELEYIVIEVIIPKDSMKSVKSSSSILPILCYVFGSDPILQYNNDTKKLIPCPLGYDINQQGRASGMYSLDIPIKNKLSSASSQEIVIGMYIQELNVEYSLQVRGKFSSMKGSICPFDCGIISSNNNSTGLLTSEDKCNQNRACTCPSDRIDFDCSQAAVVVDQIKGTQVGISRQSLSYAYFVADLAKGGLKEKEFVRISFQLPKKNLLAKIYVSARSKNPDYVLPTPKRYYNSFIVGKSVQIIELDWGLLFDTSTLSETPVQVIFGITLLTTQLDIYNSNITIKVMPEISAEVEEKVDIDVYLIVSLTVGTIGMCIVTLCVKKYLSRRKNLIEEESRGLDEEVQRAQLRERGGLVYSRRLQKITPDTDSQRLSIDIIEVHMPAFKFGEMQAKQNDVNGKSMYDACAVCLGEFEEIEICRKSICGHVFHADCLENWLKKQENCPVCREDLNYAALKKFSCQIIQKSAQSESGHAATPVNSKQKFEVDSSQAGVERSDIVYQSVLVENGSMEVENGNKGDSNKGSQRVDSTKELTQVAGEFNHENLLCVSKLDVSNNEITDSGSPVKLSNQKLGRKKWSQQHRRILRSQPSLEFNFNLSKQDGQQQQSVNSNSMLQCENDLNLVDITSLDHSYIPAVLDKKIESRIRVEDNSDRQGDLSYCIL